MSEEEKKAIKDCDVIFIMLEDMMSEDSANDYRKSYLTLKNLIEKQQKEIEELKNEVMEKELIIDGMKEYRRIAVEEMQEQYYVSKDKIRDKIKEINAKSFENKCNYSEYYYKKEVLQELLKEE